jgi:hypothetical protein
LSRENNFLKSAEDPAMMTLRMIERLWNGKSYLALYNLLIGARPERAFGFQTQLSSLAGVTALAIIRRDALNQSAAPFCTRLIHTLLNTQEADGGWGDLVTTTMCVRALACNQGAGVALERGLAHLAHLQKAQGIWPDGPMRRMPEDPKVSLFILYELGHLPAFRAAIRFDDARAWFERYMQVLSGECAGLWERAKLKCRQQVGAEKQRTLFAAA